VAGVDAAVRFPQPRCPVESLRIRLFGPLEISVGRVRLPPFATRKSRSLFSYLLMHTDRAHPRDVLAGMFWGDMPEAVARKHLRDALWRIRQVIAGAERHGLQLEVEAQVVSVGLAGTSWLDTREFETGLRALDARAPDDLTDRDAGALHQAVDLYRADLLQEVYDDWCTYERDRLRMLAVDALQRLMQFHSRRDEWLVALGCGHRLLAADPLHEVVHRGMMRCYASMGNRAAAVRQYRACAELLHTELGVEPAPDTTLLYDRICLGDGAPHPAPDVHTRAAATEVLRQLRRADLTLRRTRRDVRAAAEALRRAGFE
jgi:DNA-binding SARP family transcriptional activator